MANERLIPLAAMEKIMRDAGADRVSDSAKQELKRILEEKCKDIAEKAIKYCNHAGRKTVKVEDIKLAIN